VAEPPGGVPAGGGPAAVDPATAAVQGLLAAGGGPAAAEPDGRPPGDQEVEQRLAELDELLARVEQIPGPAGELAMEGVAALAEVYGAALTRAMAYLSSAPALVEAITRDDLLGHLLALHGIHPEPAERRIARALDDVRTSLGTAAAEIALLGVGDGVAEVRVPAAGGGGCGSGCGCSSPAGVEDAVRDAVLAAAPELADVRLVAVEVARPATFIPLDSLLRAPAGLGAPR
jgi:hypothetical protein